MSERRIKLLELAVQAGATIENATKVADDWEQWANSDDPLRLGIPSPKNPGETESGIDWNRQQLVIGANEYCGQVIETNGTHGDWNFTGKLYHNGKDVGAVDTNMWPKKHFKYHGEIPQEQPAGQKTTGLNILDAISSLGDKSKAIRPGDINGITLIGDALFDFEGFFMLKSHFLANDWQIIEQ